MIATLYLDLFQLRKNVCLASQPGDKFASGFTVCDVVHISGKVVANNEIDL